MPPPCPWQFIRQEDCQMRKPAQLQNGLCVDSWLGGSLRRWTFWSSQLDSPKRASVGEVCWNTFCRRVRRRWCQAVHVLHSMSMASNQLWKWRERRSGEVAKYLKHLETVLPNGPSLLMTRIPAWDGGDCPFWTGSRWSRTNTFYIFLNVFLPTPWKSRS